MPKSIVLALLLAALAALAAPVRAGEVEDALAVLDALHASRVSMSYDETDLAAVIDDLNARLPVPVSVDWNSLIRLGVDRRDRVTLDLSEMSGAHAMAAVCLSLGDEFERPIYEVRAGQVVLTTIDGAASMRVTDVYDVRDLLDDRALVRRLRDEAPPPEPMPIDSGAHDDPADAKGESPESAVPTELPAVDVSPPDEDGPAPPARRRSGGPAAELVDLLLDHVDPEAWFEMGGTRAKLTDRAGAVVVSAPPTTHWRLRDALRRLRSINPATVTLEAAIVELPRATLARLARRYPPGSAALVGAVRDESTTATLWQATLVAKVGESLEIRTRRDEIEVQLALDVSFDREQGRLDLGIEALSHHGDDHRSVRTSAGLLGAGAAALVEMPAATPGGLGRYLVIVPQR